MAIYELRTYTLYVGKLNEAIDIYLNYGWPAIKKYEKNLIKYFIGDIGALNQIIHVWQFDDDNHRREVWKKIFSDEDFLKFASKLLLELNPQITNIFSIDCGSFFTKDLARVIA